jgi:hypothetical protein
MGKNKLSPEVMERVCRLNSRLTEAANWIAERARRTRNAYLAGGGLDGHIDEDSGDWEDYELEAIVKCSLGNEAKDFNPNDEYNNLVAVVGTSAKHDGEEEWSECAPCWGEGLPEAWPQTPFSYLFHEIYDHTLRCDLAALLRIGEIEINLVLIRQRGTNLDPALWPGKRKSSYARSVFARTPLRQKYEPLTARELRYARLLNKKMAEARQWIEEQARRSEKEYAAIGGLDGCFMGNESYEDCEMIMDFSGVLGESHPEFNEDDDNIIVNYKEPLYKNNQHVFGRARNPFLSFQYGIYFSKRSDGWNHRSDISRIQPCGLFWNIFRKMDYDWLKMLSIGGLWLDLFLIQRRIVLV